MIWKKQQIFATKIGHFFRFRAQIVSKLGQNCKKICLEIVQKGKGVDLRGGKLEIILDFYRIVMV